jgi:hypothetical protein
MHHDAVLLWNATKKCHMHTSAPISQYFPAFGVGMVCRQAANNFVSAVPAQILLHDFEYCQDWRPSHACRESAATIVAPIGAALAAFAHWL